MSLERVLALAGAAPAEADPDGDLLLAVQLASRELAVLLASDDDDEKPKGKQDSSKGDPDDDDEGGGHSGHPAFKAFKKRGMPDDRASQMCARQDKKVKAARLADSLAVMLSGQAGVDIGLVTLTPDSETAGGRKKAAKSGHALPDGSYPIEDKKHLHSAAVLASTGHGDAKAAKSLVRKRARELGVDVNSLPGFGQKDDDGEKAAASMVELAAKVLGDGGVAMTHGPHTGTHTHTHFQSSAHAHPHQHVNDNRHDGGPLHRPGSTPKREMW
jgi:pyruvate/2-oxoglutarate dehydrogenase complex dihydrolipoamide acyltransferase (E2) component